MKQLVDFHSHILPGIDDGSRNLETSRQILERSYEQGVEIMVATPHFYAWNDRIDRFLRRRQEALDSVLREEIEKRPRICVGAEVAYFDGISTAEDLSQLTICGTDVLLLELPYDVWRDRVFDEVEKLTRRDDLTVVLAHLERFLDIRPNRKMIKELLNLRLYVQVNAESLVERKTARKVLGMFKSGDAHLLGSDCHGMHRRPPNVDSGFDAIEAKLGAACTDRMIDTAHELLKTAVMY